MDYLIDFRNMEWENPLPGLRVKIFITGNQKVRIAEFSDIFVEDGWCTKGHAGYVLDGEITIEFDDKKVRYQKGDGMIIPSGEQHRHKPWVAEGTATLVFFEKVAEDA